MCGTCGSRDGGGHNGVQVAGARGLSGREQCGTCRCVLYACYMLGSAHPLYH